MIYPVTERVNSVSWSGRYLRKSIWVPLSIFMHYCRVCPLEPVRHDLQKGTKLLEWLITNIRVITQIFSHQVTSSKLYIPKYKYNIYNQYHVSKSNTKFSLQFGCVMGSCVFTWNKFKKKKIRHIRLSKKVIVEEKNDDFHQDVKQGSLMKVKSMSVQGNYHCSSMCQAFPVWVCVDVCVWSRSILLEEKKKELGHTPINTTRV